MSVHCAIETQMNIGEAVEIIYTAMDEPEGLSTALRALCSASAATAARIETMPEGKLIGQTSGFTLSGNPDSFCLTSPNGQRVRLFLIQPHDAIRPIDIPAAQRLLGHLLRALHHASRAANAERQFSVCSQALDRLAVGAVFLDADGAVLRSAGLADDVLGARDGLSLRRGRIAAKDGGEDRVLQSAIRNALGGTAREPATLAISRPSMARDLGVIVQPLAHGAVVLIRDAERGSAPENAVLQQLFGMTPTEAELARRLSTGLTLDESAESMSISRNTARAHLRAIFSKSGITRQTELVRLMLGSAAVLAPAPTL